MSQSNGKFYFGLVLAALLAPAGGCGEEDVVPGDDGGVRDVGTAGPTFDDIYASSTFQMCADCHAPGAPGSVVGIEATQDWSTRNTAFSTLQGNASGLEGNFAGCNGVPLIGATSSTSLLVAALDANVRATFSVAGFPDCTGDAIADQTLHVGAVSPTVLQNLKDFIDEGGFN